MDRSDSTMLAGTIIFGNYVGLREIWARKDMKLFAEIKYHVVRTFPSCLSEGWWRIG
jgi:hypothetical protein